MTLTLDFGSCYDLNSETVIDIEKKPNHKTCSECYTAASLCFHQNDSSTP